MRYAIVDDIRKEPAYSGQKGSCPFCGSNVVARCGDILANHWAHVDKSDCVGCSSPMTDWHKSWQDEFPIECQEIKVGDHRADILVGDFVIEVQHSSLPGPEIKAREAAYKNLVWIIDVTESYPEFANGRWQCQTSALDRYYYLCESPLFLDMGMVGVCLVKNFEKRGSSPSGEGTLFSRVELAKMLRDQEWLKSLKPIDKRNEKAIKKREKLEGKHVWGKDATGTTCVKGLAALREVGGGSLTVFREPIRHVCLHARFSVGADSHGRYGWESVSCADCGNWLGNRPAGQ